MARNEKSVAGRPTLADIVAGRRGASGESTSGHGAESRRIFFSTPGTSTLPGDSARNGRCVQGHAGENHAHNDTHAREEGKQEEGLAPWGHGKIDRAHLQALFAEGNGVRRDNVIPLLKRVGITVLPNDSALEPYFGAYHRAGSSISLEQWISLVERVLWTRRWANNETMHGSERITIKHRPSEMRRSNDVSSREASSTQGRVSVERSDDNRSSFGSLHRVVTVVPHKPAHDKSGRWLTGNEEMDVALLRLFIHCGALERKGKGLVLFVRDFKRMTHLRQKKLPPKSIVLDATFRLCSSCPLETSSSSFVAEDVCLTLPVFLGLIEEELRGFTNGDVSASDATRVFPPTLCMVLASLAPDSLQQLCGANIVEYLCTPSTVTHVVKVLKSPVSLLADRENTARFYTGPLPLSSSGTWQHPGTRSVLSSSFSSTSRTRSVCVLDHNVENVSGGRVSGGGSILGGLDCVNRSRKMKPPPPPPETTTTHAYRFSSFGSFSAKNTQRGEEKSGPPRYMEQRPLDEISASIVARSKARRAIDELRKNAIPINRYECFARIEYVQEALFDEAKLEAEEDSSDDNVGNSDETHAHRRGCFVRRKVRPLDVAKPLLFDMYKADDSAAPRQRRSHSSIFETLFRERFRQVHSWRGLSEHRSGSSAAMSRSTSQRTLGSNTHVSGKNAAAKGDVAAKPPCGNGETTCEVEKEEVVEEKKGFVQEETTRRSFRTPPMLSDVFATRRIPIPACSQPPPPEVDGSAASDENSDERTGKNEVIGNDNVSRRGSGDVTAARRRNTTLLSKKIFERGGSAPAR